MDSLKESNRFVRPQEACAILKVDKSTLTRWADGQQVKFIRTKGGHRRYLLSDLYKISQPQALIPNEDSYGDSQKRRICYARVSTHSQRPDLQRQVDLFNGKYPDHEIISDVGSGLNFKRKGLVSILDAAINGDIQELIITHKDRLCRFGFELFERIIQNSNGQILVLDQKDTSPTEELTDDILSIITVFSARVHGLRSHSIKKQLQDQLKGCSNGNGKQSENDSADDMHLTDGSNGIEIQTFSDSSTSGSSPKACPKVTSSRNKSTGKQPTVRVKGKTKRRVVKTTKNDN